MKVQLNCYHCHTPLEYTDTIGRREECPKCRADVHVCKNCRHYDAKAYNECREPAAEVVLEKERANFCDFFEAKGMGTSTGNSAEDLIKAAESLFKKK